MGFIKHGQGEVLPEDEQEQKTAAANWTDQDREELAEELNDEDR